MKEKKKVLVTGGAGFIGSHVVDGYIDDGYEVVVVDNLVTGRIGNLNPRATLYQVDIRDSDLHQIIEEERPQIINHHAAQVDVRRSVMDPIYDAEVNVLGSLNLLECARNNGVERFIYISTGGAVYGEPVYLPCDEEHPVNPICQYGASKHIIEHYLYMYYVNYGLDYTILRYPNVYGPRQDPHGEAGVIAIFTGQMLNGKQVVINGDGLQARDFLYVGDCAMANLLVTKAGKNGIFNLGSGIGTTITEVFKLLKGITDYHQEAVHGPAKTGETRRIYLDSTKAKQELGWRMSVHLRAGLERTVNYFVNTESIDR